MIRSNFSFLPRLAAGPCVLARGYASTKAIPDGASSSQWSTKLAVAGLVTGGGLLYSSYGDSKALDLSTWSKRLESVWCETKPFLSIGSWSNEPANVTSHGTYDLAVVGGGIIGLATARQISMSYPKKTIVVVEKEKAVAGHQTGHNSGVIHAGIYYKPGSDMAQCCVDGAAMMYEYCEANGVPCERVGKLIVAADKSEYPILESLLIKGKTNGVKGLEIIDAAEIKRLEPNVSGYAALLSPNTGIADFAEAARSFAADIKKTGRGEVLLNYQVDRFDITSEKGGVKKVKIVGHEPGQVGPTKTLLAKNVITCCGTNSDKVALKAGGSIREHRVTPFRGRYYQMTSEHKNIVKRNIYPVPNNSAGIAVGIHFTPTIDNNRGRRTIVGPGCCMATHREGYRITDFNFFDMCTSLGSKGLWMFVAKNMRMAVGEVWRDFNHAAFLKDARNLVPSLTASMTEPSFSGVMAQVFEPDGTSATDFIYELNAEGNMIHVRNAPSPACTASMAIAKHISAKAGKDFGWDAESKAK